MSIWHIHVVTTPRCSELGGCATLPQLVQPWVAALSLAWLSSAGASMTRHWHHDTTSHLGSTIASMTRHRHRTVAKSSRQHHRHHDSVAPSPFDIDITSWPSRIGSAVASMTWHRHCTVAKPPRQLHRQYDSASTSHHGKVTSAAPSPAWLSSSVASMTRHWHHATAWSSTSTTIYDFSDKKIRC
jgi:hypothetical protein